MNPRVSESLTQDHRDQQIETNLREKETIAIRGPIIALERRVLCRLLRWLGNPPIAVSLPGTMEISPPQDSAVLRVLIRDRLTLWKLVIDPIYQFGEAYAAGKIEVEGDLTVLLSILSRALLRQNPDRSRLARFVRRFRSPRSNSRSSARNNIRHHYDIGNDFYQLWLDERLVYTCAYFPQPSVPLEAAQVAKMDHICRKLRLRPGQTVVEAGCGWGAFALHMAEHFGVNVKAYNISREQIAYARQRAKQKGLDQHVEFIEDDWRNIDQPCDMFVSVGMLEHVGLKNYRDLGDVIERCLKPEGLGLIHTIGQNHPTPLNPWIERRIFPGAYPPALGEIMGLFEPHNFSVLDVENLRLHYAQTLWHWLDRFEKAADSVRQMFDERFVRIWRLYLAGSYAAFESGSLQLFQLLFARGSNNKIPWSRADIYSSEECRIAVPRSDGRFV